MKMIIIRTHDNTKQTIGLGFLKDESGQVLHTFATLELPYKNNMQRVSAIPCGTYKVVKRYSLKFKHHFYVLGVQNRELILIHSGNFVSQTQGCILVGHEHKYINSDSLLDVASSHSTLQKLLFLTPTEFTLIIQNAF